MGAQILGALVVGCVLGGVDAFCGAKKGKIGLAIGGFVACVIAGLLLGMILAIPVCAVFLYLIYKNPKKTDVSNNPGTDSENTTYYS